MTTQSHAGAQLKILEKEADTDRVSFESFLAKYHELSAQNVELPSGRIESRDREFAVLSRTGLVTPEQFRNIIVKIADGHQVKLGEVARVELGAEDERRDSRYNGQPAIAVGVVKQAVANPLDVSKAVRAVLRSQSISPLQ